MYMSIPLQVIESITHLLSNNVKVKVGMNTTLGYVNTNLKLDHIPYIKLIKYSGTLL